MRLLIWTLVVLAIGGAVGLYTYFVLLKDVRTPHEVTVQYDHEFEAYVLEKHPGVRFIRLSESIQFVQTYHDGKKPPAFEMVSPSELVGKLKGNELIFIVTERRYDGIARIYAVHAETPILMAFEELVPKPLKAP